MKYKITLNNKVYEVAVEQGEAVMVGVSDAVASAPAPVAAPVVSSAPAAPAPAAPTPAAPVTPGGEVIPVPLPGNVVSIMVAPGQSVKKGQTLAVVEAMKMENDILSPRDGVIGEILVTKGATVHTGMPLMTLQ